MHNDNRLSTTLNVRFSVKPNQDQSVDLSANELSTDLKRQGFDVSPRELETLLEEHPTEDLSQYLDNLTTLIALKCLEADGKVVSFERAGRKVYAATSAGYAEAGEVAPTPN